MHTLNSAAVLLATFYLLLQALPPLANAREYLTINAVQVDCRH